MPEKRPPNISRIQLQLVDSMHRTISERLIEKVKESQDKHVDKLTPDQSLHKPAAPQPGQSAAHSPSPIPTCDTTP